MQVQNGKIATQETSSSQLIYYIFCESTNILVHINPNKPTNKHTPYGVRMNTNIIIYIISKESYTQLKNIVYIDRTGSNLDQEKNRHL
jgi:hypothetical protein